METITVQEIQELRQTAIQSGWVYVSSLAMRTFRKTPLLKRWCEIRTENGAFETCVMEFYRDRDDFEPTKRINLGFTRVVVSHGRRFTQAQFARIPSSGGPLRATAFYIDFPPGLRRSIASASPRATSPFFETRSMRADPREMAEDFPLGFIMVAPDAEEAWENALINACNTYIPRESKRERVQRWINRAWMRIRGDLSIDQFDESFRPSSLDSEMAENFFSIGTVDGQQHADALKLLTGSPMLSESGDEGSEHSFQTAGTSSASEDAVERQVMRVSFRMARRGSREPGAPIPAAFSTVEEMLAEKDDETRHSTPISLQEINSTIDYVEGTKVLSLGEDQRGAWALCCTTDTFDCFKSIDEKSGLVRTRTWARIAGVPPQTMFHILYNNEARKNWDHHYARFDTIWIDEKDPNLDILDAIVSAPIGCANREFLEWRRRLVPDRNRDPHSGKFVIFLRSWSSPESRPVLKGNVRAEVWLSAYLIQWWTDPSTGQILGSDVMVMTQIDIKGLVPKYLVNALSNSAPKKWVKGVTNAAVKELEERGIAEECLKMSDQVLDAIYNIHGHEV
jgi:hypothetical protein